MRKPAHFSSCIDQGTRYFPSGHHYQNIYLKLDDLSAPNCQKLVKIGSAPTNQFYFVQRCIPSPDLFRLAERPILIYCLEY
jgi:hypothetical protein